MLFCAVIPGVLHWTGREWESDTWQIPCTQTCNLPGITWWRLHARKHLVRLGAQSIKLLWCVVSNTCNVILGCPGWQLPSTSPLTARVSKNAGSWHMLADHPCIPNVYQPKMHLQTEIIHH